MTILFENPFLRRIDRDLFPSSPPTPPWQLPVGVEGGGDNERPSILVVGRRCSRFSICTLTYMNHKCQFFSLCKRYRVLNGKETSIFRLTNMRAWIIWIWAIADSETIWGRVCGLSFMNNQISANWYIKFKIINLSVHSTCGTWYTAACIRVCSLQTVQVTADTELCPLNLK